MANPLHHHHALESLRFAFDTLGLDESIRYLHALQPRTDPLLQLLAPRPQDVPSKAPQPNKKRDPNLPKYQRATLPDDQRCSFILPKGSRCSFDAKGNEYCKRHLLLQMQLAADELLHEQ
jgi:hypothetical protein